MPRLKLLLTVTTCLALAAGAAGIHANGQRRTLVVTMTNDLKDNQINVYDADSHELLQTLSTHGKGGVGGNARGIKQLDETLVAVVNNGSNSVALFKRDDDALRFDRVVSTTSAPVSVDFGNDHMYVAGATSVDSFLVHGRSVDWLDGTTGLGAGRRRDSSGWQHGAGRRDWREAAPGNAESGSRSRHGRRRGARSRPGDRRRAHGGFRACRLAGAVRLRDLQRRHRRSSRLRTRIRTRCSATRRSRRSSTPVRLRPAG